MAQQPIAVKDISTNTGHDACPPTVATSGNSGFTINGHPVVQPGDTYAIHGCPTHEPHIPVQEGGRGNFTVNGIPVSVVTDKITCPEHNEVATGIDGFTITK